MQLPDRFDLSAAADELRVTSKEVMTEGSNFRVHGNGFIQIDMPDKRRVHVWGHADIPHQATASQIHSHKFSFYSLVQYGTLINVSYKLTPYEVGAPLSAGKLACDAYIAIPRDREDTVMEYDSSFVIDTDEVERIGAGEVYGFNKYDLHETFVNSPTITVMKKKEVDPDYVPLVLTPAGIRPDNDFNRYSATDESKLRIIVEDVFRYWGDDSYR